MGKQNKNNQQYIIKNDCFPYSYNGRIPNDLKPFYTGENKEITNIKIIILKIIITTLFIQIIPVQMNYLLI